jgi:hypothetical protein
MSWVAWLLLLLLTLWFALSARRDDVQLCPNVANGRPCAFGDKYAWIANLRGLPSSPAVR